MNRLCRDAVSECALKARVGMEATNTRGSLIGQLTARIKRRLIDVGIRLPLGVWELVVMGRLAGPLGGN